MPKSSTADTDIVPAEDQNKDKNMLEGGKVLERSDANPVSNTRSLKTPSSAKQVSENEKGWDNGSAGKTSTTDAGGKPKVMPADGIDLGDTGGDTTVTDGKVSQTYSAPAPQGVAVQSTGSVGAGESIYGNTSTLSQNGAYTQNNAVSEAKDRADKEMDQVSSDANKLKSDIQDRENELNDEDRIKALYRINDKDKSDKLNNAEGSAYQYVEPQSSWGRTAMMNSRALASNALTAVNAAGDAVNRGLDVFNRCLSMTFQGGLNPGSIGHAIGMSFDATGAILDRAVKDAGKSQGIDIEKLKQDKNAIGTFKGMQSLQEEADIQNQSLDVQKVAGQAMAEAIGWKGGEMRPEYMENALKNLTGEQLKKYGERLMAARDSNPDYQRIMGEYARWTAEHPGESSSRFPISVKDKALVGAYNQLLQPYKQAMKESDLGYKQRAKDWQPYKRRAMELKREAAEAARQGKTVAKERMDEFRQDYYNSLNDEDKAVMDLLGGPMGDFSLNDIDEYGNLNMNAIYRAGRKAESAGVGAILAKENDGIALTPWEQSILTGWRTANQYIRQGNDARAQLREEKARRDMEEYRETHTPLLIALKEMRIDGEDPNMYSQYVYGQTLIPKTFGRRDKVRDAAEGIRDQIDAKASSVGGLSPEDVLRRNSAECALYVMDLQDRFETTVEAMKIIKKKANPAEAARINKLIGMLKRAHMAELSKYDLKDLQSATVTPVENKRLSTFYDSLDNMYGITTQTKERIRQERIAREDAQRMASRKAKEDERNRKKQEEADAEAERKARYDAGTNLDRWVMDNPKGKLHQAYGFPTHPNQIKELIEAAEAETDPSRKDMAEKIINVVGGYDKMGKIYKRLNSLPVGPRNRLNPQYDDLKAAYREMHRLVPISGPDAFKPNSSDAQKAINNFTALLNSMDSKLRKFSKSALYERAMKDPVIRDAFSKAISFKDKDAQKAYEKEREKAEEAKRLASEKRARQKEYWDQFEGKSMDEAAKQMAGNNSRSVRTKAKDNSKPKAGKKEEYKRGGGRHKGTSMYEERSEPEKGRINRKAELEALGRIPDEDTRFATEGLLRYLWSIEDKADTEGAGYTADDLRVIRDVVSKGARAGDEESRQRMARYNQIMNSGRDTNLNDYYNAYLKYKKATSRFFTNSKVDPKSVLDAETHANGKQLTSSGVRGRNKALFGQDADMKNADKRVVTQVLKEMGLKTLPMNVGMDEFVAVLDRMDDTIDRMYGTGMRKEAVALRNRYALDYISDRAKKAGFTLDDPEIKAEWDNLTGKYMSDLQRGSDRIEPLDVAGYYNRLMDIAESRLEKKKENPEKLSEVLNEPAVEMQTGSGKNGKKTKAKDEKKTKGEKKPVAPPVQPVQEPASPPAEESVDDGFLGTFDMEEYDPDEDPYNM